MERKQLKKEVEKLLGDYVGTTLREKEFDPKGRKESTLLDEMAHYDLAIGVALQWLSTSDELKKGNIKLPLNQHKYPNRMEREAMILSTFAGTVMNHLPVEDVFEIYGNKNSATQLQNSTKGHWTQAFNLSLHPFAMLTAPQAAEHALKHCSRMYKSTSRSFNSTAKGLKPQTAAVNQHETDSERENTSTESLTEGSLTDLNEDNGEDSEICS
ncbi:uncharacterized protein C2orf80 homolog isoform X1 [Pelobates fuscus]|uniref:uncharacterized protein C2orf80 homolog isoform X1 n=2 Tax=Pelobates fuscus TaxID=191477 RepID=UPI002FE44139